MDFYDEFNFVAMLDITDEQYDLSQYIHLLFTLPCLMIKLLMGFIGFSLHSKWLSDNPNSLIANEIALLKASQSMS